MRWLGLGLCIMLAGAASAQSLLTTGGQLSDRSTRIKSGEFGARHVFPVTAGQVVAVRLRSTAFTPYLIVTPPGGQQIDGQAANGVAEAFFVAGQAGDAEVVVTTARPGEQGVYQMAATQGLIEGQLGLGDRKLETGELTDLINLWMPAGKTYTVEAASDEFDVYLITHAGARKVEVDDTLGQGHNARALVRTQSPGPVTLQVTSRKAAEQGAWRLQLTPGVKDLREETRATGTLSREDPKQDGRCYDLVSFVAVTRSRYTVTLTAPKLPARLVLVDAGGDKHEAPLPAGTINPQVTFENPADGVVHIQVIADQEGALGDYQVTVVPLGPPIKVEADDDVRRPVGTQLTL
jgi:hypothetical protein